MTDASFDAGTVTGDGGTVTDDSGTVTDDSGTVTDDGGTVTDDSGTVTDDGGTVTDDGGTVTDDGGTVTDDGGTVTDDGGTNSDGAVVITDAATGPDTVFVNTPPEITSAVADPTPWIGSTDLSVATSDADGHAVTCVLSDPDGLGLSFDNVSADGCEATLHEPGSLLPAGTSVTVHVVISDGHGGSAETDIITVMGNHDPVADAGADLVLWPGQHARHSGTYSDVDNNIANPACDWTAPSDLPAGVDVVIVGCNLTLNVNRNNYLCGGYQGSFSLTVLDQDGASASDSFSLTVRDERGPYVDNTSSYSGIGDAAPYACCGTMERPCSNMDDALVNTRSAVNDGADFGTPLTLKVASTGSDYQRDTVLNIDAAEGASVGVECGFDASDWSRPASFTRTPIRFTSDNGLFFTATDGILIEGCDIQGVDNGGQGAERAALVFVDANNSVVQHNTLIGNIDNSADAAKTRGLYARGDSSDSIQISGNDMSGGLSSQDSSGLSIYYLSATVIGNTIAGGQASHDSVGVFLRLDTQAAGATQTAIENNDIFGGAGQNESVGVDIASGFVRVMNNTIKGGSFEDPAGFSTTLDIGVRLNGDDLVPFESNYIWGIFGSNSVNSQIESATAIFASSPLTMSDDVLVGGEAGVVSGLELDGDPSGNGNISPFDVIIDSVSIEGGIGQDIDNGNDDQRAYAVWAKNGVSVQVANTLLTNPSDLGLTALTTYFAWGVYLDSASQLTVTGGRINAGSSIWSSVAVFSSETAGSVLVQDNATLQGGDASNNDGDARSFGIYNKGSNLSVSGSNISSGSADDLSYATVYQPFVPDGGLCSISDSTLQGGESGGSSRGLYLDGGDLQVSHARLLSGKGGLESSAAWLNCNNTDYIMQLSDSQFISAQAPVTAGLSATKCTVNSSNSHYQSADIGAPNDGRYSVGAEIAVSSIFTSLNDSFVAGSLEGNDPAMIESVGLSIEYSGFSVSNIEAAAGAVHNGNGGVASVAIKISGDPANSAMDGGRASAAGASSQNGHALSAGLYADGNATGMRLSQLNAQGAAAEFSYGMFFSGEVTDSRIENCGSFNSDGTPKAGSGLSAGAATTQNAGLYFKQAATNMTIANNVIDSDTIGVDGLWTAGVYFETACEACRIDSNFISAGNSTAELGRSVGLRNFSQNGWTLDNAQRTYVSNNVISSGSGVHCRGLEASGNPGDDMRYLHNVIHGGKDCKFSAAVYMGEDFSTDSDVVGAFVGNILDAGQAEEAYSYFENCTGIGLSRHMAKPHRAANSNFWPRITSTSGPVAYVHDAKSGPLNSCAYDNWDSIEGVNRFAAAEYLQKTNDNRSWDLDPKYMADGYHIAEGSELRDKSLESRDWWSVNALGPLSDIFAHDQRDLAQGADIGCDELP